MMARVETDASHVSRSVTARREKTTRYIRVPNRFSKVGTFSSYTLRLRVTELLWERFARFQFLVFGDTATDLSVGVRSAAAAPYRFVAGSWDRSRGGTEAGSGVHVDPLTRHSPALRSTGRIIYITMDVTFQQNPFLSALSSRGRKHLIRGMSPFCHYHIYLCLMVKIQVMMPPQMGSNQPTGKSDDPLWLWSKSCLTWMWGSLKATVTRSVSNINPFC